MAVHGTIFGAGKILFTTKSQVRQQKGANAFFASAPIFFVRVCILEELQHVLVGLGGQRQGSCAQ